MPILENLAASLGSAIRAFEQAREPGHGPARRPAFLSSVAEQGRWKGGVFSGDQDAAAVRAMQNSWIYMMIQRKSMEKSAASLYVVDNPQGLEDTGTIVPQHDLLKIMRSPNPHMDGVYLSLYMDWWLDLMGNTYLFLAPDAEGRLAEIWPMPANAVNPIPGDKERFIDYYEYLANGTVYRIPAEYVYHEMYPNPYDIFRGLSPLISAILPADADTAMAFWNGAFFGEQNVMPSAVISLSSGDAKSPLDPADVDRIKGELGSGDYGAVNRKTIVTNAYDMAVSILGWNARDMDFLNGRAFTKEEIILILGGYPGMFDKNATEANATVADNMFKEKTIWPNLRMRAGRITNHILRRFYSKTHEARYVDIRPINRQLNVTESDASAGVLTVDERRKRFWKADPLPDGRGKFLASEMQSQAMSAPGIDFNAPAVQPNITALPNPQNAALTTKSLGDELKAWKWRATKSLSDGRPLDADFISSVISANLKESILDGLATAASSDDVKEIFDRAQKGIIRSWRPWSSFELFMMEAATHALKEQLEDLLSRLREYGTADPLTDPITWQAQEQIMRDRLQPIMEQLALSASERVKRTLGDGASVNVDWNLANENAASWARQHAGEMITNVTNTTKTAVGDLVASWSQTGEGIDGLIGRITNLQSDSGTPIFNQGRAEAIAITESTNTYAGANNAAWSAAGYAPAAYKPGAHVRCRCYLQPYKMPDGAKVMSWYTALDERVCTQDLSTPWGTVKGCKGLHKTVVSEGKYLGQKV